MKYLAWLGLALLLSLAGRQEAVAQGVPYSFTNYAGVAGVVGTNDGPALTVGFNSPAGIVFDPAGNLLVADLLNHTIRKISPGGVVSTLAGSPGQVGLVNGTLAVARFNNPHDLAFDAATNLYVSELLNHTIRKITPDGTVTTFAGGNGQFNRPVGITFDLGGNLYVADSANHVIRLVTPGGLILTLAGIPGGGGFNNGPASAAQFYYPSDVTVAPDGNTYVADAGGYMIRKISPMGDVTTVAGSYRRLAFNDGIGSVASFTEPSGVGLDTDGSLLVGDSGNHLIRRVTTTGVVTTIGGLGGQAGSVAGLGTAARFNRPLTCLPDGAGGFFVSDPFNHRISHATPVIGFPQITQAPASQTFGTAGTTLVIAATGTAPLTYQWQRDGTNLLNATNLTLTVMGQPTGAGTYRVIVTNPVGTVTSAAAILSFLEGPRFYAGIALTGVLGRQYRIEVAEVTVGVTNWTTLTNLTLGTNPTTVLDPASAGVTNRYYRAVLLP